MLSTNRKRRDEHVFNITNDVFFERIRAKLVENETFHRYRSGLFRSYDGLMR